MSTAMRSRLSVLAAGAMLAAAGVPAATLISTKATFMGTGVFHGPGKLADVPLFELQIHNISITALNTLVTPFTNNGPREPNICAEPQIRANSTGMLSDGSTPINENVDACSFKLNDMNVLAAAVDGGLHHGEQLALMLDGGEMIMTMDFALDLGNGPAGIIKMPFYGTTGAIVVPQSLQTQMQLPGGVDSAGSVKSGTRLRGRLGDFNKNGLLDGAMVVAGNIPLTSQFMPGAPYAFIRYFETDMPYDGQLVGRLPGERSPRAAEPPVMAVVPADSQHTSVMQPSK